MNAHQQLWIRPVAVIVAMLLAVVLGAAFGMSSHGQAGRAKELPACPLYRT